MALLIVNYRGRRVLGTIHSAEKYAYNFFNLGRHLVSAETYRYFR